LTLIYAEELLKLSKGGQKIEFSFFVYYKTSHWFKFCNWKL